MKINYYAYTDKADINGETLTLELHCLRVSLFRELLSDESQKFRAVLTENTPQVIIIETQENLLRERFKELPNAVDLESSWYMLDTNDRRNGLPATLYDDNNAGTLLFINSLVPAPAAVSFALAGQTSMADFPDADILEIRKALDNSPQENAEHVTVYNVGQGNSNALCNAQGMPLLYFDLGGGCFHNRFTYPSPLRFCFTLQPTILLSHWDTDHYETAKRIPAYREKTWIVPRQNIGPLHFKFFLELTAHGKVLIWPRFLPILDFRYGSIGQCTHHDPNKKNHTGLALMLQLSPKNNQLRRVILPSDSAYVYLPFDLDQWCDMLVATHHGAEFDHGNAPVPSGHLWGVAYSYGKGNTYHHPRIPAMLAHHSITQRDTPEGHIGLTRHGCQQGCRGIACDLEIRQWF